MTNKLKVVEPFYNLEVGDELVLTEDGKNYVFEVSESNESTSDNGNTNDASFTARFTLSVDYAKALLDEGYLEEVADKDTEFKNVFTEIDNLLDKYRTELSTINDDFKNLPACLKLEKKTVLGNLVKVLQHLRDLKK